MKYCDLVNRIVLNLNSKLLEIKQKDKKIKQYWNLLNELNGG